MLSENDVEMIRQDGPNNTERRTRKQQYKNNGLFQISEPCFVTTDRYGASLVAIRDEVEAKEVGRMVQASASQWDVYWIGNVQQGTQLTGVLGCMSWPVSAPNMIRKKEMDRHKGR